jgi:hypothetical protein
MHDTDDGFFIRLYDSSNSSNVNIGTLVVIYALNVHGAIGFDYNVNIVTGDAAIGPFVY